MQSELFSIMTRISYFWWDDDNICFVLDQCAKLDFYSASSMKQPSTVRRVVPLRQIILVFNSGCYVEKQQIPMA
jgi:hypothetical protein